MSENGSEPKALRLDGSEPRTPSPPPEIASPRTPRIRKPASVAPTAEAWGASVKKPAEAPPSRALSRSRKSSTDVELVGGSPADGKHAHAHGAPSVLGGIAAGTVCFVLYFFFCIVFSAVIFSDLTSTTSFGVADGVGIVLLGIGVGCLVFSHGPFGLRSGCKVIISGPDLIPIISVQECGRAIQAYLAEEGSDGAGKIIPTTLVAMIVGNLCVGVLLFALGRARKTSAAIGFVPASVISGFLSCIGYKVIKLAVFISTTYELKFKYVHKLWVAGEGKVDGWLPLLLALIIGAPLYALKRKHIVRTDVLILSFIVLPLAIFYVGVAIAGAEMQQLRDSGWFLTTTYGCAASSGSDDGSDGSDGSDGRRLGGEGASGPYCAFERVDFWRALEGAYSAGGPVAWSALPQCIGIWLMGACITALDCMLKLSSSENALKVDLEYNHEMQVGGAATILSALLGGMPSYGQTKFNVINHSIVHSTATSVPTLTCGLLSLLTILAGVAGPIINGLPRFLLAGLLVYSGAGFLVENLLEGHKRMTRTSFGIMWTIFVVNFLWEFFVKAELPQAIKPLLPGLLVVFVLGIVLAAFEFIAAFMTKAPPADPVSGAEVCSSALRPQAVELRLGSMASWYAVVPLHGFLFFGSATLLYQKLKALLGAEQQKQRAERLRYVLLDCQHLTGVDPTACNTLAKARRLLLDEHGIELVWAGLSPKMHDQFEARGLLLGSRSLETPDVALKWLEDELLRRSRRLTQHVIRSSEVLEDIHHRSSLASVFSIATSSPDRISSARLLPHATRLVLQPEALVFDQQQSPESSLYLLFVGEVELVESFGRTEASRTIFPGSFFNHQRCCLRQPAVSEALRQLRLFGGSGGAPVTARALTDVVLLKFSQENFASLQRAEPQLALQLLLAIVRQGELQRPGRTRPTPVKEPQVACSDGAAGLLAEGSELRAVQLTSFQRSRFMEIFDLIDEDSSGSIQLHELTAFTASVGREIPPKALARQLAQLHGDRDGDGVLSRDEFYELVRSALVAPLPAPFADALRQAHAAAAAASPERVVRRAHVPQLLRSVGVVLPEAVTTDELLDVMDADGSGDVDVEELLVGAGMLRRSLLEMEALAKEFEQMASDAQNRQAAGEGQLTAAFLARQLSIPVAEAEDIVFLSDLDRFSGGASGRLLAGAEPTIDVSEFYRHFLQFS